MVPARIVVSDKKKVCAANFTRGWARGGGGGDFNFCAIKSQFDVGDSIHQATSARMDIP